MWARLINAALGIWLMAAPAVLGYGGSAQVNDRIVGPMAAAFAITAIWEVTRALRWGNAALGGWLLLAPLVLRYDAAPAIGNSLLVGFALLVLALVPGRRSQRLGGGWAAVWRKGSGGHS